MPKKVKYDDKFLKENGMIMNPKTGRYILENGPTAKKLASKAKRSAEGKSEIRRKVDPENAIRNPLTGRLIKIGGPTYNALATTNSLQHGHKKNNIKNLHIHKECEKTCKTDSVCNNRTGRCNKLTTQSGKYIKAYKKFQKALKKLNLSEDNF